MTKVSAVIGQKRQVYFRLTFVLSKRSLLLHVGCVTLPRTCDNLSIFPFQEKMSAAPWEQELERNLIFIENVFNNDVCEVLRGVFKKEWDSRYHRNRKLGKWDDSGRIGEQLFDKEKTRTRPPNKCMYLSKFQNGDTSQWDCTVLFDAILYSNSIGKKHLKPGIQRAVDDLRIIRNEIKHSTERKLTDGEFQRMIDSVKNSFKNLGVPNKVLEKVEQIEIQRNRYPSFQILPAKPAHDVVYRHEKISEIVKELDLLYNGNDGKLTYLYISGSPGSGKSQLASQIAECIYKSSSKATTFVMTLKAEDFVSLLSSYEDFCRHLNCDENGLVTLLKSDKPMGDKIKDVRSLVTSRMKNWRKWLLIVDNVENLTDVLPLLSQTGEDVWNNGQVIITCTQDTTSIPPDSSFSKHVSISAGMNDEECRELLSSLSGADPNDPLLDEVAERLDRQPLALAKAACYMGRVFESKCPNFSWKDYLDKLKRGKGKNTEKQQVQHIVVFI